MEVYFEEEIIMEDLNVKGFADCIVVDDDEKVYLYDIKTMGAWAWKMKFGRNPDAEPSIHQDLQVATYGIGVQRKFKRLDGMYLVYYNKDNSTMKQVEVPKKRMITAKSFWEGVIKNHERGLPSLEENVSPVMDWECRYCEFVDKCKGENNE